MTDVVQHPIVAERSREIIRNSTGECKCQQVSGDLNAIAEQLNFREIDCFETVDDE